MDKKTSYSSEPSQQEEAFLAAADAGLRYVHDQQPGFRRRKRGKKFVFVDTQGKILSDEAHLRRIKRLAIPPAWTDVWICPHAAGHLQATGRDARGRKQYRYHTDWRQTRDETKYDRLITFGRALPKLRRHVARDLTRRGLPREKVLATVVRLLETTLIRVGNDEYARANHSYGLTTMRDHHVAIRGTTVTFSFRGKSGKKHVIDVENQRLAQIVKKCRDLPGYDLFQYLDPDGVPQSISSTDVNDYLRRITGENFTAKDFRTWAGTVLAARALQEFKKAGSKAMAKRNMLRAIEAVAQMLGNTPSICRRCYIHPWVLNSYLDGTLIERLQQETVRLLTPQRHLRPEEAVVLRLLQRSLRRIKH